MVDNILFVSVETQKSITKNVLEKEFPGLVLSKIENSYVAEINHDKYIFASSFGVITFCNFSHEEIKSFLERLNVKDAHSYETALLNQDYPMIIDPQYTKPIIDEHTIKYNKFDKSIAAIISLVLSQSVGMEISEHSLENKMVESCDLYEKIENLKIKDRQKLMNFASRIAKERFNILNKLYLLDKPDILWDNLELESLYNQLSLQLEIQSRFEVIEYKISYLKESVEFATESVNHKTSEFLEWIIIWLIVIEVFFSINEYIVQPLLK